MSKISLKHSGGNVVSLNSPTNAPGAADVAFKLPNADGSAGQYMKTDGSGNLSFGAVTVTNDFVKLQAATGTSAVSALLFQNLDVTTYRTFKIVISAYPVTDGADLYLRLLDGSTYKTGAGTYNWSQTGTNGAGNAINGAGNTSYAVIGGGAGNNNYEGWRTEITYVPHVSGDPAYQNNFGYAVSSRYDQGNSYRGEIFNFKFHQSDVTDGIQLYPSSGNFAAYSYTLYGLKR